MPATGSRRWIATVAALAVAAVVFWFAVEAHLRSACVEQDTPYLPLCPAPLSGPDAVREELKQRLARNPGDAWAWTSLLVAGTPTQAEGVMPGAVLAAPHNHNVARWQAAQALQQGQLPQGVALLVEILRHRGSPESARVLAQLAVTPQGLALLRPHLASAKEWLPQVLEGGYALKMPPGDLLPLVAAAVEKDALPDEALHRYMRTLKASGQWLDAYGLWVSHHKDLVPLLYNSGFDQPIEVDGFDWEFATAPRSRAGVLIEQEAVARRGLVLDIDFTGRSFPAPILRQYLFLAPGTYRVRGEYMAPKLRSEEGLAWSVQCTAGRRSVLGRSEGLRETGGVWKPLQFEFTVPADCGAVASLQLDPAAAFEATTGIKGSVSFDAFSLTRAAGLE
jgi:hypothetical protein